MLAVAITAAAFAASGAITAQAAPADYAAGTAHSAAASNATAPEFYIVTVHIDGRTSLKDDAKHAAEAFPEMPLAKGGGLVLTPPDGDGYWNMRAFVFEPSQVFVYAGDRFTLNFVGVQGPSHRIQIDGRPEVIDLKRGEVRSVQLDGAKPGTIGFRSLDRLPSMQGQVVVLPRP